MSTAENILPNHIGLITDGNRRWAKKHNLPSFEGHRRGFEAVKAIIQTANDLKIKVFTVWAFSTENWDRSKEEVGYLMNLFEKNLDDLSKKFSGKDVKINVIGQIWRLNPSLQKKIAKIHKLTQNNGKMVLNIGISYGGRDEIVQAAKNIGKQGIDIANLTEKNITDNVFAPNVDLIIRTGGEQRLSGFLMWQSQYAELYFAKKYLPDFTPDDFKAALANYSQRQRRYGK